MEFPSLVMSSAGWHVLATDIPPVLSTVLLPNIEKNLVSSGSIQVRQLDWTVPPGDWLWDNPSIIASHSTSLPSSDPNNLLQPPFDIICTADTVYNQSLIEPLLRTLHALCTISQTATPDARSPPVYICLERRDPDLVDRFLASAHDTWNFDVHRIPHRRLAKAIHKAGTTWSKEDWEGIEIWKFTLPKK
ncbi:hypothetical protein H0H93_011255 [Arthromyces matolae]|nr:hypothetical protein H0H93_011255 [Arthromyces matolae]